MKYVILSLALLLAACNEDPGKTASPNPTPEVVRVATNACHVFKTLEWAIPIVEGLTDPSDGVQQALDTAQAVLDRGCTPGALAAAETVAAELVKIIYGI